MVTISPSISPSSYKIIFTESALVEIVLVITVGLLSLIRTTESSNIFFETLLSFILFVFVMATLSFFIVSFLMPAIFLSAFNLRTVDLINGVESTSLLIFLKTPSPISPPPLSTYPQF